MVIQLSTRAHEIWKIFMQVSGFIDMVKKTSFDFVSCYLVQISRRTTASNSGFFSHTITKIRPLLSKKLFELVIWMWSYFSHFPSNSSYEIVKLSNVTHCAPAVCGFSCSSLSPGARPGLRCHPSNFWPWRAWPVDIRRREMSSPADTGPTLKMDS